MVSAAFVTGVLANIREQSWTSFYWIRIYPSGRRVDGQKAVPLIKCPHDEGHLDLFNISLPSPMCHLFYYASAVDSSSGVSDIHGLCGIWARPSYIACRGL